MLKFREVYEKSGIKRKLLLPHSVCSCRNNKEPKAIKKQMRPITMPNEELGNARLVLKRPNERERMLSAIM